MLQCSTAFLISALLAYASCQQNGDVRLEDDDDSVPSGRVEVYLAGEIEDWTPVCFNYKDLKSQRGVAQAVCRQLGFYDFKRIGNATAFGLPNGTNITDIVKRKVDNCPASSDPLEAPQHIFRCHLDEGECDDGDDMAVECDGQSRGSFAFDTMVDFEVDEIMEGSMSEGFANVYINGDWGPVCNMGKGDADAFCRQLSYTNSLEFGEVNSTIDKQPVLSKFHCSDTSEESCLRNCFDYPSADQEMQCPNGYSYVTCTFQDSEDFSEDYGTKSLCSAAGSSKNTGRIVGAVVGSLLAAAAIAIVTVALCFLVPGCYCHRGKRGSYSPAGGGTKYDSI